MLYATNTLTTTVRHCRNRVSAINFSQHINSHKPFSHFNFNRALKFHFNHNYCQISISTYATENSNVQQLSILISQRNQLNYGRKSHKPRLLRYTEHSIIQFIRSITNFNYNSTLNMRQLNFKLAKDPVNYVRKSHKPRLSGYTEH